MQLAERARGANWLHNTCGRTFHSEFGATPVLVDEHKQDKEEDTGEASQTHGDGDLRGKEELHQTG